ncbi:MAG TPA: O-antigen ligase family protein, partial [Acidimicrobiia bacterium]
MTTTASPPTHGTTIRNAVIATDEPPRIVRGMSAWFERWWVPCLVLPMIMSSDFKWRRRAAQQALAGGIDIEVIIEVCIYAAVFVYLIYRYGKAPRWARTDNLMFLMWAWTSVTFVSAFYSLFPKLGIVRAVQFIIVATLAQTIANHATLKHLHRFAHAYLIMLSAFCALGYVWHGALNKTVAGRFHWMYLHPVPAGVYVMCGTVIAAAYWRSSELRSVLNFWPRWVYAAVCSWIGLALLLTKTRGSIIAAAVALTFVMLYHTSARHKVSTFVLSAISGVTVIVGAGGIILAYLERGNSAQQLATLNDRTNLWKIALGDYVKRPFFGYGLGAARGIFLEQIKLGGGHNAFINVLTDQGGLGIVVFVSLLGVMLWRMFRFQKGSIGYRESYLLVPLFVGL